MSSNDESSKKGSINSDEVTSTESFIRNVALKKKSTNIPKEDRTQAHVPPPISDFEDETIFKPIPVFEESKSSSMGNVKPLFNFNMDPGIAKSEHLRIAQEKIIDLEKEVERLRRENEKVASAGEMLERDNKKQENRLQRLEKDIRNSDKLTDDEVVLLREKLNSKERDLEIIKAKLEELEFRFLDDLKKIRVRERELENRLELIKVESHALLKAKDDFIMDLKRKVNDLNDEQDRLRKKGKDLNQELQDREDKEKRALKALKVATSLLELPEKK